MVEQINDITRSVGLDPAEAWRWSVMQWMVAVGARRSAADAQRLSLAVVARGRMKLGVVGVRDTEPAPPPAWDDDEAPTKKMRRPPRFAPEHRS